MSWCSSGTTTASAQATGLLQQFHSLHASVLVPACCARQPPPLCAVVNKSQSGHHQRLAVCPALPPGQQQQQRRTPPRQQQQPQQLRRQNQPQRTQRSVEQQTFQTQSQQQAPQQQQQQQQQAKQQKVVWGYLDGDSADGWTWDDDYNEAAIAKAAAEARKLPPTPRQVQMAAAAAAAARQRPTVITRLPEQFNRQVLSNAVLLVDKPARWSSADVVRQLKSALKYDRVCFGAPLDMEASGLLIILLGAASRLTPKFEPLERTYTGTLRLGLSTTTYDASGETLESNPWQHITDADLTAAAANFVGEQQQLPCMWSSSKYKNKPLRWYAERGEVVAREPKSVHIASIQLWRAQPPPSSSGGSSSSSGAGSDTVCFRVVAGKGASIRVLVHDLGRALGCGAHVTAVRREGLGGFSVETAWSLDTLLPLARKYAKGFRQAQQH